MSYCIIPFEKMQGLGNDFVVIHHKYLSVDIPETTLAKRLCDRRFGIGADGLIILKPVDNSSDNDFVWEYINSDGSYGEMCGNGMRCFARYVYDRGLTEKEQFSVQTRAGIIIPQICPDNNITVNMGKAISLPTQNISVRDKEFVFNIINIGNPHAIAFIDSIDELKSLDLAVYGSPVECHPVFPKKTNVEFACIKNNEITIKVWERGAGETMACGTGACATVMAAHWLGLVDANKTITTHLSGGDLFIRYDMLTDSVFMTGDARSVFIGQIELEL